MKNLVDKFVHCVSCSGGYTIMFKSQEETKQSICPTCKILNIHARPKSKKVKLYFRQTPSKFEKPENSL